MKRALLRVLALLLALAAMFLGGSVRGNDFLLQKSAQKK